MRGFPLPRRGGFLGFSVVAVLLATLLLLLVLLLLLLVLLVVVTVALLLFALRLLLFALALVQCVLTGTNLPLCRANLLLPLQLGQCSRCAEHSHGECSFPFALDNLAVDIVLAVSSDRRPNAAGFGARACEGHK